MIYLEYMKQLLWGLLLCFCVIELSFGQTIDLGWAKAMGGTASSDIGKGIALDANNNVYTTGTFQGVVDFDPNAGVQNQTSTGDQDIFIQKLDAAGNLVWVKQMGGTAADNGQAIAVDVAGNIYTVGEFRDTVDLDPNTGVQGFRSAGLSDIFIQKLDANGNLLWVKQIGGTGNDRVFGLKLDAMGNIGIAGHFMGTVDFDPNASTQTFTSLGGTDIFVAKLDPNGNLIWAKQIGGSNTQTAHALTIDTLGNFCLTGHFRGTADFDPGANTFNLTNSTSNPNIFVFKLDTNGDFVWAKKMTGNSDAAGYAIAVDSDNNIYSTGYFRRTVDFDPNAGVFNLVATTSQQANIFIQKLTPTGNLVWARQMGDDGEDIAFGLTIDQFDDVYVTGHFERTVDFDLNAGVSNLTSNAFEDIFIQKIDSSSNFIWATNLGGGSSDYSNSMAVDANNTIYTTGFFKLTVDFDPDTNDTQLLTAAGSEDIYVLKLNQPCSVPLTGTDVQTACGNYTWIDGTTYTSNNNTATYTLQGGSSTGCDSIVTLNLTINQNTNGVDVQTACGSYVWIDGNTYTSSNNTAMYTLQGGASTGCDSIVTLDLTITTTNASINQSNDTLVANIAGATYQWLDCATNTIIAGATGQQWIATANGDYAVIITQNGCTDTSACMNVTMVGLLPILTTSIQVYPNPSDDLVYVELKELTTAQIKVLNSNGQVVQEQTIVQAQQAILSLKDLRAGLYWLVIVKEEGVQTLKIRKE